MAGAAVRAVRVSAPALLALGLAGLGAGVVSDGDEGGLALGRDGGFLGGGRCCAGQRGRLGDTAGWFHGGGGVGQGFPEVSLWSAGLGLRRGRSGLAGGQCGPVGVASGLNPPVIVGIRLSLE